MAESSYQAKSSPVEQAVFINRSMFPWLVCVAACLLGGPLPASASIVTIDLVTTKDSYIRSGQPDTNFGSSATAQVKRSDDSAFTRKTYLGFDVSALPSGNVLSVELIFQFVDSRLGPSVPSTTEFVLYGLTDQLLDGWFESTITWTNAPANNLS